MSTITKRIFAVIGGGSGGLSVAAGAVQKGARCGADRRPQKMGGDCLNYGCVPSKALLAQARAVKAPARNHAKRFYPRPWRM